jgi:hypothetical protein
MVQFWGAGEFCASGFVEMCDSEAWRGIIFFELRFWGFGVFFWVEVWGMSELVFQFEGWATCVYGGLPYPATGIKH